MKSLGMHDLRREYLEFFKSKGHKVVPSFSLVPKNDKSLLLIGAGMAPLKKYFTGELTPPSRRMSTCQTCIRTGDIDNVGKTDRHGTFFEMLGNFSFGDYFKKEAIGWAWEFLTEVLEMDKDKIWVTVYKDDDEAFRIWNEEIGIPAEKIVRLGKKDNFWELEVGPSGPCSEIYFDRGEEHGCGDKDCKPGCDCDRFMEVWNLVFTQFDKDHEGVYHPLPNPNIDTGMGLERMATVMQGVGNIFEVDEIAKIIKAIERVSGYKYKTVPENDVSVRVITDHVRAMTFLVADGVVPSNEGRGYVLRRLIRRAARHGRLLGVEGKFLSKICNAVIDSWSVEYEKLSDNRDRIIKVIETEEEKFRETIDSGMLILSEMINSLKECGKTVLPGVDAFKLYDTYGFPLDLSREILSEQGISIDEQSFENAMKEQKERARAARGSGDSIGWDSSTETEIYNDFPTEFTGYDSDECDSSVEAVFIGCERVERATEGEECIVLLTKTPFYGKSGGQAGDIGFISSESMRATVLDTNKTKTGAFLHLVRVDSGELNEGFVHCEVDSARRDFTRKNHSATHLLHRALKDVLGEHVNQAGSEVLPTGLRFDFTHYEAVSSEDLKKIERKVNEKIYEKIPVETDIMSLTEATNQGVIGLFEDKYGDTVRVLKIGDYSRELCGGTHVSNTADIGIFKILAEYGIASGVRRIEAITSAAVYEYLTDMEDKIDTISDNLKTTKTSVVERSKTIFNEMKELNREMEKMSSNLAAAKASDMAKSTEKFHGFNYAARRIDGLDSDRMRAIADDMRSKFDDLILILVSEFEGKVLILVSLSKKCINSGLKAGAIVKKLASIVGGGGGGRDDMATAGGKNPEKIDEVLETAKQIIEGFLN